MVSYYLELTICYMKGLTWITFKVSSSSHSVYFMILRTFCLKMLSWRVPNAVGNIAVSSFEFLWTLLPLTMVRRLFYLLFVWSSRSGIHFRKDIFQCVQKTSGGCARTCLCVVSPGVIIELSSNDAPTRLP